jgi:hypothetical protein
MTWLLNDNANSQEQNLNVNAHLETLSLGRWKVEDTNA